MAASYNFHFSNIHPLYCHSTTIRLRKEYMHKLKPKSLTLSVMAGIYFQPVSDTVFETIYIYIHTYIDTNDFVQVQF